MLEWLALAEIIFMNKLCYKKKAWQKKNVMLKVACDHWDKAEYMWLFSHQPKCMNNTFLIFNPLTHVITVLSWWCYRFMALREYKRLRKWWADIYRRQHECHKQIYQNTGWQDDTQSPETCHVSQIFQWSKPHWQSKKVKNARPIKLLHLCCRCIISAKPSETLHCSLYHNLTPWPDVHIPRYYTICET